MIEPIEVIQIPTVIDCKQKGLSNLHDSTDFQCYREAYFSPFGIWHTYINR